MKAYEARLGHHPSSHCIYPRTSRTVSAILIQLIQHQVSLQQFNKNCEGRQVTGTLQQMNITSKRLKKVAIPGEKPKQQSSPLRPYSNLSSHNPQILQQLGEREDEKKKTQCKAVWLNICNSCTNSRTV